MSNPPSKDYGTPLTPRELQVLQLTCRGLPVKVVARRLGVAPKTVETLKRSVRYRLLETPEKTTGEFLGVVAERLGLLKEHYLGERVPTNSLANSLLEN